VSVGGGDLMMPIAGPEEGVLPLAFRDVATTGDNTNVNALPQLFTATFQVNALPAGPYDITVSDDPDAGANLLATDLATDIPHVYDSSATTGIVPVIDPAVISTSIASGDPTQVGTQFTVSVDVSANP